MANWQLVDIQNCYCRFGVIGLLFLTIAAVPLLAFSHDHGKVRMYKLNKKDQFVRQKWLKNVDEEGCHNTFKTRQVHQISQYGYSYCTIYTAESCKSGTEIPTKWLGSELKNAGFDMDDPQIKLVQGSDWFLHVDENVAIKSWFCVYDPN